MKNEAILLIKGMVCRRCVMVVRDELAAAGHLPLQVDLGRVTIAGSEKEVNTTALQERLAPLGFSLLQNRNRKLVQEVKAVVAEVYGGEYDFPDRFRFSQVLQQRLQQAYDSISDIFAATEGCTIEQYSISFRIGKVKEFLVYSSLTLADMAFKLNFNSVAHLSAQFKQHTGLTPSYFRNIKDQKAAASRSANDGEEV